MSELRQYLSNPNVQNYLNMVSQAEGTAKFADPYRVAFGGKTFESTDNHPNIRSKFTQTDGKENVSSAAGKYQFLKPTWDDVSKKLGLKDFSQESQDIAAVELLRRSGSLNDVVNGDFETAVQKDGKTWASLPSSPYPQSKRDMAFVMQAVGQRQPAPAQPATGGPSQPPSQPTADDAGGLTFDKLNGALQNAKKAKNTEAVDYFSQQLRPKYDGAVSNARAAGNVEASEYFRTKRNQLGLGPKLPELGAKIYQQIEGRPFEGNAKEAEEYAKSFEAWKNNLFSQGKKAIDVGGWGEDAKTAYLDLEDAYEGVGLGERFVRAIGPIAADPTTWVGLGFGKLAVKTGQEATKAAIRKGLEQSLVKRVAQSTGTKVAAEGAVYGAVQDVAGQAGRVAAGGQQEIDLGQTAKVAGAGAVLGAGAGKVIDKLSGVSAVEKFARRSGSEQGARIDAEISQELGAIKTNPNFRDQPLRTEQINQVGAEAIDNAKASLNQIGAKGIAEAGEDPNKLLSALSKWKKANPDDLRGTEIGDAVADAITKAQRVRSLTAEQEAAGGVAKLMRGGLEVAPIPNAVRLAGRAVLGGSQSRKQVTSELLSNGNLKAADRILRDMGPSGLSDSASRLSLLANNSLAARAAASSQVKAAKGTAKTGARKGPMDSILEKVRAETQKAEEDALAAQFSPPEDLVSLATRSDPSVPLPDNAPIFKTIQKNAADADAAATQARDFQQFGTSPGSLVDNANRVNGPSQLDETSIMDVIRKATLENSAMGMPDGKTFVGNDIKNILAGGKVTKAEKAAATSAQKSAEKQAKKEGEALAQKAKMDAFMSGQLPGNMSPEAGGFQATLRYVNGSPEEIQAGLRQLAQARPDLAQGILDMFTPGKKAKGLYEIQNNLFKTLGKREQPPAEGAGGILSQPSRDLDAQGNEILSKRAYEGSKTARQRVYKSVRDDVTKDDALSKTAKKAVKEAIDTLATGSPKNKAEVLSKVQQELAKVPAAERDEAMPYVQNLIDRFYTETQ